MEGEIGGRKRAKSEVGGRKSEVSKKENWPQRVAKGRKKNADAAGSLREKP